MPIVDPEKLIAERARNIEASGIRKVFDMAATLTDPVNLSIGQPHFSVPQALIDECNQHMQAGKNGYTPSAGLPVLKEKLLARAKADNYSPEAVMVTSGTSGGLTMSLMALVSTGDDVLIPDPFFVSYKHLVTMTGGRSVPYSTYPDFKSVLEPIKRAFTEQTKVVIVNSPGNPTGVRASDGELREAVQFVESNGAIVLSDEIYSTFVYDEPFISLGTFGEHVIVLNALSKSHAMTGWRLGWAYGPKVIIENMTKLQQFTFVCAPSMVQHTALSALDYDMANEVDEYRGKRDRICDGLADIGYDFVRPQGAIYVFPKSPIGTGTEFVEAGLKQNLMMIPGNVFSESDTHFRISFAATDDTLDRGLQILKKLKENT